MSEFNGTIEGISSLKHLLDVKEGNEFTEKRSCTGEEKGK